ncbi:MAG TPA: hypothetical protein VHM20_06705 [Gammaproteobacteria bacterium]|nr:hypothetical protein [Gammaproteobacteria bacterium]
MKDRIVLAKKWINARSTRDQFYIFLVGLAGIYLVFLLFFYRPLLHENTELRAKIADLNSQKTSIQQQMETISHAIEDPIFIQMIDEEKRLTDNLKILQAKLLKLKPRVIQAKNIPSIIDNILTIANPSIDFVKLEELPVEPWLKGDIDKETLKEIVNQDLYQHAFKIEFISDYFSTLNYFKKIEKLPWPIYWDSMEYKVQTYPKADVVIKFHVLSIQKS